MNDALLLASAVGHAALLLWIGFGKDRSRPTLWLALLSADFLLWTLAAYVNHAQRSLIGTTLDASCNALAVPLAHQFVQARARAPKRAAYVSIFLWMMFGALALSAWSSFFTQSEDWVSSRAWAGGLLFGLAIVTVRIALMLSHAASSERDPLEVRNVWLTGAAFVLAGVGLSLDLAVDLGLRGPRLGSPSVLLATILLALVTVRRSARALRGLLLALGFALLLVTGAGVYGTFRTYGGGAATIVVALLVVLLVLGISLSNVVRHTERARAKRDELVLVGRMTSQLLHDLKNPMAALLGATEVLEKNGRSNEALRDEMLTLVRNQSERLAQIVDRYGRMSRVLVTPHSTDVVLLAERVVRAFRAEIAQRDDAPELVLEVAEGAPKTLQADSELLTSSLENLLRNALEALAEPGEPPRPSARICVSCTNVSQRGSPYLVLSVKDNGPGMDAETRDAASADFATTKTTGSGLGLSFVRRVAEGHGGRLTLVTQPGQGCEASIWLPVEPASLP